MLKRYDKPNHIKVFLITFRYITQKRIKSSILQRVKETSLVFHYN